jgi:nitroreductase
MKNEIIDAIFQRRSIRKFAEQPVEHEKVQLMLQAAMAAPSASNTQPWEFVVVDDPEVLKKLKDNLPLGKYNSPLCIVVCGNPEGGLKKAVAGRMFWVQDCSAATENILIAAVSLGLGTVWCGVHPIFIFEGRMRAVLGIPKSVTPLGVIHIGYPAEKKEPGTKYQKSRVHWQKY